MIERILALVILIGVGLSFALAFDTQVRKSAGWLAINFAVTIAMIWLAIQVLV